MANIVYIWTRINGQSIIKKSPELKEVSGDQKEKPYRSAGKSTIKNVTCFVEV